MGVFFTPTFWMWIPLLTIVPMIPPMCYYDWKIREIPDWIINAIYIVNLPLLAFMYLTRMYGWEEVVVSLLPVVIFYAIMRMAGDYFHGDDFMIAAAICLFCVVNPLQPDAGAVGVKMMIYLIGTSVLFLAGLVVYNLLTRRPRIEHAGHIILLILSPSERGFPFIFPIAAAFLLALIL